MIRWFILANAKNYNRGVEKPKAVDAFTTIRWLYYRSNHVKYTLPYEIEELNVKRVIH